MHKIITRESVCIGDDIDAPHQKYFRKYEEKKLSDLFNFLINEYLPSNVKGGTFWLIKSDESLLGGVEFPSKKSFTTVPRDSSINDSVKSDKIHAECLGQVGLEKWLSAAALPKYYI